MGTAVVNNSQAVAPARRPEFRTRSGKSFDFFEPHKNEMTIEVIAHALSNICRFGGHTSTFYSVAQHSVLVSYVVPAEDAYDGLMHDAAEAFTGDIASPLKELLPDFRDIERRVEAAVWGHFGVTMPLPRSVKDADLALLVTECRDLMPDGPDGRLTIDGIEPLCIAISPLNPGDARALFLNRYRELRARKERA